MMNPGPVSSTAKQAIDALKASPMVLALLLFNMAFIAMLAYITAAERMQWAKVVELLAKTCGPGGT
jgi:hypothetical protein